MTDARKPTLLLVAPVPPPMHGAAYATQLLLDSSLAEHYTIIHIDARYVDAVSDLQGFSLAKVGRMLRYLGRMLKHCLRRRVDLVILEPAFYPGPFLKDSLFIIAARLLGPKVVAWYHMNFSALRYEERHPLLRWYVARVLSLLHHGVCVGQALIDGLPASLDRRRLHYLHNGIPGMAAIDRQPKSDAAPLRVMYLSNMGVSKGWRVLFAAAQIACRSNERLEVHFYGSPMADSPLETIEEEFAKAEAPARIVYHGPVYGDAKDRALREADVFCFPSMYPPEAFPLTILEAMSAGLPIVTTTVGAVAEAVDEGRGGCVVPQNDAPALAEALLALAADPERCASQGAYNRRKFEREFTVEAFGRRWSDFVRRVLD